MYGLGRPGRFEAFLSWWYCGVDAGAARRGCFFGIPGTSTSSGSGEGEGSIGFIVAVIGGLGCQP